MEEAEGRRGEWCGGGGGEGVSSGVVGRSVGVGEVEGGGEEWREGRRR